jgi:hypothetical protein
VEYVIYKHFIFCGPTVKLGPKPAHSWGFWITQLDTHTHTHTVGLLWTSDRLVGETGTYTTHNKHNRRISTSSAGFEPAIPAIKWPHRRPHGHRYGGNLFIFYFLWLCSPARAMASSFTRFLDHTRRRATAGGTPLDEWSARRKDHYLTTHNRQTSMPLWDSNPRSQLASGRRPRGHWNQLVWENKHIKCQKRCKVLSKLRKRPAGSWYYRN